jgi:stress response protein SCP2
MAINLQKGQRINLEKSNGNRLQSICVGINWGAIEKKGLFGFGVTKEAVDLDASCALFDEVKNLWFTLATYAQKTARYNTVAMTLPAIWMAMTAWIMK